MSEGKNLNRRDLLKLSAVFGGLLATRPFWENQEKGYFEDRFFEDLSGFNENKSEKITKGLLEFGDRYEELFKSSPVTSGFDREKWNESVKKSVSVLERISTVYQDLLSENVLGEKGEFLLNRDFYDEGSKMWAILRIGEMFKDDPKGLKKALGNVHVDINNGFKDPLLGNEAFGIKSPWADNSDLWFDDGCPLIVDIINKNDLAYGTSTQFWWRDVKGPEGLPVYNKDPNIPGRPAIFSVEVGSDSEVKNEILKTLHEARLDRVGVDFKTINDPSKEDLGGEYFDIWENSDHKKRGIEWNVSMGLTKEYFEKYPFLTKAVPIHEGAHGLWELVPFLKNDMEVFKYRVFIEKMLDIFRPQRSLEDFFQPDSVYYKTTKPNRIDLKEWDTRYQYVDKGTITNYASRKFAKDSENDTRNLMQKMSFLANSKDVFIFGILDMLVQSPGYKNINSSHTFSEFWTKATDEIKNNSDMYKPNVFEEMIFDEISKNPILFNAEERQNYVFENDWRLYLDHDVVSMVMVDIYNKRPDEFEDKLLQAINRPGVNLAVGQAVDKTFQICANKMATQWNGYGRGDLPSDRELFAEIFTYNYLRKKEGAIDNIDQNIWKDVDFVLNSLIDDLVDEGLAISPNGQKVM